MITLRFLCDTCDVAIGVRVTDKAPPDAQTWAELASKPRIRCPACGAMLASIEERKAIGAAREGLRREASDRYQRAAAARLAAELRPCSSCNHSWRSHSLRDGCNGGDAGEDCACERFTEVVS